MKGDSSPLYENDISSVLIQDKATRKSLILTPMEIFLYSLRCLISTISSPLKTAELTEILRNFSSISNIPIGSLSDVKIVYNLFITSNKSLFKI